MALIHACVLGTARMKLPAFFGKTKGKVKAIENLSQIYQEIQGMCFVGALLRWGLMCCRQGTLCCAVGRQMPRAQRLWVGGLCH